MRRHARPVPGGRLLLPLAVAALAASPALAQTLADCRAIGADRERLACYDALSAPATVAAPAMDESGADQPPTAVATGPVAEATPAVGGKPSALGVAWELDDGERGRILRPRSYKPVYLLPYFHARRPNRQPASPAPGHTSPSLTDLRDDEAKLQFSFKSKLIEDVFGSNGDLWFGYTQSSRWQVYDGGRSRPFRETDHEPEAMLVWRTDYRLLGWRGRLLSVGINHQSNGRSLPLSRSWNRVVLAAAFERDDWILTLRPWWRIPESDRQDDNPDIADYLGRADVQLQRSWNGQQLSLLLRHSLRSGADSHGAVQLDYAFPIAGQLRGHLQWFSGYGESLIDYNHRSTYYGLGVSLLDW